MKRLIRGPVALVLACSLLAGGCSFVFTTGPSSTGSPPQVYPECTESLTWPVVDGILGVSFLLSGLGVLGATHDSTSSTSKDGGTAATVSAVLFAAAFGAGAYVGYSRVSRCKATREAFLAAHPEGMQPVYGGYGAGGPPIGAQGGMCTQGNTCDAGLVCAGMPDHTNRCMPAQGPQPQGPGVGAQGGACTAQLTCNQGLVCSGMADHTNRCIAIPTALPPQGPGVGMQGGACTPQLTCNQGLVCAGMPDHTNQCMPAR